MNTQMSQPRIALYAALLAGMLVAAVPSHAFRMIQNNTNGRVTAGSLVTCDDPGGFVHWDTATINWRHNTANQGGNAAGALQNAMASWTNVVNADHTLVYAGTTTNGWATDGVNTVLWASGNGCTGSCLALTALVLQNQVIIESDITFDNNDTWQTNGNDFDIEAVAAHEFGHSLGIHHTDVQTTPRPTMYATYFGTDGRTLHADDIAALQCAQSRYPVAAPTPGGSPATPASLTVEPLLCLGLVDLTWSASAGATSYQLQQATNSSFTNAITVYTGPDTYQFRNGTGTRYFRVRACNANGCSLYRNGNRSAPYYPICL